MIEISALLVFIVAYICEKIAELICNAQSIWTVRLIIWIVALVLILFSSVLRPLVM